MSWHGSDRMTGRIVGRPGMLSAMRILLIEDEKKTAAFLAKGLREAGFTVEVAPGRRSRIGVGAREPP